MSRRTALFSLFGVFVTLFSAQTAGSTAPAVPSLERVRAYVQPSIVYLSTTWSAKVFDTYPNNRNFVRKAPFSVAFRCSGFFVSPRGHIVTAGHCAQFDKETRDAILEQAIAWGIAHDYYTQPRFTRQNAGEDWTLRDVSADINVAYGVQAAGLPQGRALPARVLGVKKAGGAGDVGEAGDVALLKIEAEDAPALRLAPENSVNVGEQIVSVGYPASVDYVTDSTFDPSFKDGTISSTKTIAHGLLKVYEIDAAVSGGMSGGPTVDLNGRVVGVNSFGIVGESQPFNFIRPSSIALELIGDKGVKNELGSVNRQYRNGLAAYFAGKRKDALEAFDQVLAANPSHALAQEYRRKALLLPKEKSGNSLPIIVGVVAGFLLLCGAAAVLIVRRGRPALTGAETQGRAAPAGVSSGPAPEVAETSAASQPVDSQMKVCPRCAEEIKAAAKVCRFCGYEFVSDHADR